MQSIKVRGEAKSLILDNGAEIIYAERGEDNKEIMITGAWYLHTAMPLVEEIGKKYHIYAVIMRDEGPGDQFNPDGSINWEKQWGKDVYDFARKLGISRFHYFGKCHGTVPGWYLVKEHPEVLIDFASFFLAPHALEQNSSTWLNMLKTEPQKAMLAGMRKPESGIKKKMEELAVLGSDAIGGDVFVTYGLCDKLWDSKEEIKELFENMPVKIGYLFGGHDLLFKDYYDSNMYAILHTKGARTVILQEECHLMELDSPERVAAEVFAFVEEAANNYE